MKSRISSLTGVGLFLLLLAGAGLFRCAGMRGVDSAELNMLPERVLEVFTLRPDELPPEYALLTDQVVLKQIGLERNPAFVSRNADRKLQVQVNAFGGFVGLYGTADEVLLLMKGYFFPDVEAADTYLRIQEGQDRRINAYEVPTPGGGWYLFFALDPEREYSPEEITAIRRGLQRFKSRLNAVPHFSQIGVEDL
ncbi:MAG: hypothetical protein JJU05_00900 [Verrucomicrobia bacterium]|nr:hypothetical protein [Verrucomicrobiota bacterium]MCH8525958.1 hypothetical protein [Kiritimatiellia bacterium]